MDTIRVELGGDDWADLKDPDSLTSKEYRRVTQAMGQASSSGGFISVTLAIRDAVLIGCVQAWSFRAKVPRDPSEIAKLDVPIRPFRRLMDHLDDYAKAFRLTAENDEEDPTQTPSDD